MQVTKLTYLTIFIMLYMFFLLVLYFSKERIRSDENNIYKLMLVSNFIGLLLQVSSKFCSFYYNIIPRIISELVFKSFLVYFNVFTLFIFLYALILVVSREKYHNLSSKIITIYTVLCGFTYFLPLSLNFDLQNQSIYTYGLAVNYSYLIAAISSTIILSILIPNLRKIENKKIAPLFVYLVMCIIALIIQKNNPSTNIMCFVESYLCFLMYHTIENPDIQIMAELAKNKRLVEKSSEDMSNFMFRMTQDIREPIKELSAISENMQTLTKTDDFKESALLVDNKARELDFIVNDVLDVTTMTTGIIKIYDDKYNVKNLFKEIKSKTENSLDGSIKLDYYFSESIPEMLYGDSIKLKQIINSIIDNSKKNTSSGYISLEVDAIIKYDIARLIITISDTGKGMPLDVINDILSLKLSDEEEHVDPDDKILSLKDIKRLLPLMNGSMVLKSEDEKGTTVILTIDQKVVETKESEVNKKLNLYEESLHKNKKILLIDEDAKELSRIKKMLETLENDISSSLFARDAIEHVNRKQKYDLIILDDETDDLSAYDVLKELKKDEKFDIPVIIMIEDDKEFIKLHYLKDGFADVILKSKMSSELERIVKKF